MYLSHKSHTLEGQRTYPIHRYQKGTGWSGHPDAVAGEEPLEIRLRFGPAESRNQRTLAITMRTPGQDEDLVRGFLYSERLITDLSQVINIEAEPVRTSAAGGHTITVDIHPDTIIDWHLLERHFYLSSSCGVCGKASIEAVMRSVSTHFFPMSPQIHADIILGLPGKLRASQLLFESTGGIHASGLFDIKGEILRVREDVGRHNAADKLIGALLQSPDLLARASVVVLSGRISFELVQKVLLAQIPILIAVGAPSTLAIDLAEESGMTLVGFTSTDRFNVYTGKQRIV